MSDLPVQAPVTEASPPAPPISPIPPALLAPRPPLLSGSPPADVEARFEQQRRSDALGHNIHTATAVIACVLICGPVTFAQFAPLPLFGCFVIRMVGIYRNVGRFAATPISCLLAAWFVWAALSILWTPDRTQAGDELRDLRWLVMPIVLWAVLDRRRYLVAALAAGLMAGVATMVIRIWWPSFMGSPRLHDVDRISGWWHPVVAGSMLTAGLGLHLPAAMLGRGRERAVGVACAVVTIGAVLATGSRGAWIASAGLLVVVAVWAVTRRGLSRVSWRGVAAGAAVAAVVGAGAWAMLGGALERRFEKGVAEVRGAIERREFTSDTGARMLMAWWAVEALAEHPVRGVGLGGYSAWVRGHLERQEIDPATRKIHDHAHNGALHLAATLGGVGVVLVGGILSLAVGTELRRARGALAVADGARDGAAPQGWAMYDVGPVWALVGLLLASAFDTIQVNSQTAPMLLVLIALCVPRRPTPVAWSRREKAGG